MKILLTLLFSFSAFATQLAKAPNTFTVNQRGEKAKAIYVDFIKASYDLEYDFNAQTLTVLSRIEFDQPETGYVLFDLVPEAMEVRIDGKNASMKNLTSPENATTYRMLQTKTEVGTHVLEVKNLVSSNLTWNSQGVASSFWMSDLNDRRYLESYVPTNMEYDQYAMTFTINFKNFPKKQIIFANGIVRELGKNNYLVTFPEHFTASSLYYHTGYEGRYNVKEDKFVSIDGRELPMTVYVPSGDRLDRFHSNTHKILQELERDYGAFPHQKIVIYGAGMGGMEYMGATRTSLSALGHELHHSYFARGVIPARGNSGWIDEAIASWRDDGYRSRSTPGFSSTQMAGHSNYRRYTDRDAYSKGKRFMEFLNYRLRDIGGLKKFIREFKNNWLFKPMFTTDFKREIEQYSGMNFTEEFDRYIYGRKGHIQSKHRHSEENPMHPRLSKEYELSLL